MLPAERLKHISNIEYYGLMKSRTFLILLISLCVVLTGCAHTEAAASSSFPSWNSDSEVLSEIISYVESVTDESADTFIPSEDRIAVFDLDGTLFCETFPIYFDWLVYTEYVLNTPSYSATEEQKQLAYDILTAAETGVIPHDMERRHAQLSAEAFAGLSVTDFEEFVRGMMQTPAEGFDGLLRGDAFYQPMLEIVDYLLSKGFIVYIVSGTDRLEIRTLIADKIAIPPRQVIGMDVDLIASGQGETDGLDYVYSSDDVLVRSDRLNLKSVKMNKVTLIAREIGAQPVLAFGNSSGDVSMAVLTTSNNPYPSAAFMVVNDDPVREKGSEAKAESLYSLFSSYGWSTISMKDDFSIIYAR